MLFHTKITALRKSGEITYDENGDEITVPVDRYGNPLPGSETRTVFYGELIARDSSEPGEPNRDIAISSWRVLLPRDITLEATDALSIFGQRYELDGPPAPIVVRGQIHHQEVVVRRVTG